MIFYYLQLRWLDLHFWSLITLSFLEKTVTIYYLRCMLFHIFHEVAHTLFTKKDIFFLDFLNMIIICYNFFSKCGHVHHTLFSKQTNSNSSQSARIALFPRWIWRWLATPGIAIRWKSTGPAKSLPWRFRPSSFCRSRSCAACGVKHVKSPSRPR